MVLDYLKKYRIIFPIFLVIIGCIQSYRQAFIVWYADSDVAGFTLLTKDIFSLSSWPYIDWSSLQNFNFPVDNWLFTLYPYFALCFHFFGSSPTVLTTMGVASFWASAFFTGLVVAALSKWSWTRGLWAMGIVLCAPQPAIGTGAFLTSAIAHHISIAWGMFGIFCLLGWIKKQSWLALVVSAFIFIITVYSDPWALPVFLLPILISAMILACWNYNTPSVRFRWIAVAGMCVISLLISQTHFFGLLHVRGVNPNMVQIHLSLHDWYKPFLYIPYFFNCLLYPCMSLPYEMDYTDTVIDLPSTSSIILNSCIYFVMVAGLAWGYVKERKDLPSGTVFMLVTGIFSAVGIIAAAILTQSLVEDHSARYIINIYYVTIIFICLFPYKSLPKYLSYIGAIIFAAWLISGSLSHKVAWDFSRPLTVGNQAQNIIDALKKNRISLAYGAYWPARANAVTWLTEGKIRMLPFNYRWDHHGFSPDVVTSLSWYKQPENKRWAFVLTGSEWGCDPFFTCQEAAINQFGYPSELQKEGNISLMIYDKNPPKIPSFKTLKDFEDRSLPVDLSLIENWKEIDFGWNKPEGRMLSMAEWRYFDGGFNSRRENSKVVFRLPRHHSKTISILLKLKSSKETPKNISVSYDGKVVAHWVLAEATRIYTLEVPVKEAQSFVTLELSADQPHSNREKHLHNTGISLSLLMYLEHPILDGLYK